MQIPYRSRRRVEFRDTDAAGIMHFSTYFTYMEQVEHEFWRTLGTSVVRPLSDCGSGLPEDCPPGATIGWPRVAAECSFQGVARFEDELEIELRVLKLGNSSITFGFWFRCGDRQIAHGSLTTVCCRIVPDEAPRSMPIPANVREQLSPLVSP